MRAFAFANNLVGYKCLEKLSRQRGVELAGVAVMPCRDAKYRQVIQLIAEHADAPVVEADAATPERLRETGADIGFSLYWPAILKPDQFGAFQRGVVNVHPSLLPCNRGSYTPTWIILDGARAGVTLHYIDANVDTGPIIAQREVPVYPWDTGETLNTRLQDACVQLFGETLPAIVADEVEGVPQPDGAAARRKRDVAVVDRLDLDAPTTARDVLDRLRARTFRMYRGCYFEANGRRVYVRVSLTAEEA